MAVVYRIGDSVAVSGVDDDLTPNFIDPLLEKYGFEALKWIVVPNKK